MSDATTNATRMNWAEHREALNAALQEASFQLSRIAHHAGKPHAAAVSRLQQKVLGIKLDADRVLDKLLADQLAALDPEKRPQSRYSKNKRSGAEIRAARSNPAKTGNPS